MLSEMNLIAVFITWIVTEFVKNTKLNKFNSQAIAAVVGIPVVVGCYFLGFFEEITALKDAIMLYVQTVLYTIGGNEIYKNMTGQRQKLKDDAMIRNPGEKGVGGFTLKGGKIVKSFKKDDDG